MRTLVAEASKQASGVNRFYDEIFVAFLLSHAFYGSQGRPCKKARDDSRDFYEGPIEVSGIETRTKEILRVSGHSTTVLPDLPQPDGKPRVASEIFPAQTFETDQEWNATGVGPADFGFQWRPESGKILRKVLLL
ncbi:hypothetical protein KM043_014112 [Ampulex compressa]|nr:hypothetical protein KM043_014112 [Ampulex compressa]